MKLWPLGLFRVSGQSMLPTYHPGDVVVGWRWFKPQVGQVVVASTSERTVIKRIKRLADDQVWVEGDNSTASTDSRSKGSYPTAKLAARVLFKL